MTQFNKNNSIGFREWLRPCQPCSSSRVCPHFLGVSLDTDLLSSSTQPQVKVHQPMPIPSHQLTSINHNQFILIPFPSLMEGGMSSCLHLVWRVDTILLLDVPRPLSHHHALKADAHLQVALPFGLPQTISQIGKKKCFHFNLETNNDAQDFLTNSTLLIVVYDHDSGHPDWWVEADWKCYEVPLGVSQVPRTVPMWTVASDEVQRRAQVKGGPLCGWSNRKL